MPIAKDSQLVIPQDSLGPGDNDRVARPIVQATAGTIGQIEKRTADHERDHADDSHEHEDELGVLPQIVHRPTGHIPFLRRIAGQRERQAPPHLLAFFVLLDSARRNALAAQIVGPRDVNSIPIRMCGDAMGASRRCLVGRRTQQCRPEEQ